LNDQEHIIETFSEMATRYEKLMNSELNRFWGMDYYAFIHNVLGDVTTKPSELVLDIATGTAFIPRIMVQKEQKFSRIVGLDITLEMLRNGKKLVGDQEGNRTIDFVCASAHEMPFQPNTYDRAVCCLATHHMSVDKLLSQIKFALKPGAVFHIGDVGGSSKWKIGFIRTVIKVFAFIYFLVTENYSRARAESKAVANVMTSEEWREKIVQQGFEDIQIREVQSSKFWAPNPIIIQARKN